MDVDSNDFSSPTETVSYQCPGEGRSLNSNENEHPTLPQSVRGAPSHLRTAIRRQQNKVVSCFLVDKRSCTLTIMQSSKRKRQRQAEAFETLKEHHRTQALQISSLKERVGNLIALLEEVGIAVSDRNTEVRIDDNEDELFEEILGILDEGLGDAS